jgi:hypothetical protein
LVRPNVRWAVFADLSISLTPEEQSRVFEAVDLLVPGSGSVGPNRAGVSEVYFVVETEMEGEGEREAEAKARAEASRLLDAVLARAGMPVAYDVHVQPFARGG